MALYIESSLVSVCYSVRQQFTAEHCIFNLNINVNFNIVFLRQFTGASVGELTLQRGVTGTARIQ